MYVLIGCLLFAERVVVLCGSVMPQLRFATMKSALVVLALAAVLAGAAACVPPNCDHVDYGTCTFSCACRPGVSGAVRAKNTRVTFV